VQRTDLYDCPEPKRDDFASLIESAVTQHFSRAEFLARGSALGLSVSSLAKLADLLGSHHAGPITEKLTKPLPAGANLAKLGPFTGWSQQLSVADALNWKVPKAKKPYRIAYMLISLQGYYFVGSAYGGQLAAKQAGVKFEHVAAQGFASPDIQLKQVRDLLQRGIDAIVLQPADVNGSVPVVQTALAKGVPVVVAGTALNTPTVAQAFQSDYALGSSAADWIAKSLGNRSPEGIIIGGPASATWSTNRVKGFSDRVKQAHPNLKIVATPNQNFVDPTEGLRSFQNAVQAHPNIGWAYSVDYNLLEAPSIPSKYQGKIAYVGMGLYGTSLDALKKGQVEAIFGIMPVFGAMVGISRAVQLLNGDSVPATTSYPAPLYTKANLNVPQKKFDLYPPNFKVS
jgi:ribose transport system substrate-binding protein